jgi:site-specific DNA recombinase
MTSRPTIRCAIYTRKSSDEGLEQNFNSLDAQYDACAAYITSQRQEGWVLAKDRFDDGGQSGGTLERPALQHLMAEIDAGRIKMIVVYKIDRLTRSLSDFARLIDRLDAAGCSFVSVTQAFNTASSMGRLTLNVLLSFAQFEREVTAERIRDKIAASKKQGMWMGGVPPLGYDPHPDPMMRELVINEDEAEIVRTLFELYDQHGSLARVAEAAAKKGLRSKHHVFRSGRQQGGNTFSNGQIHKVLTNPVYLGKIRHKELVWPGRHQAVLDQELWDRVQAKLQHASRRRRGQKTGADPSPLTGKLRDGIGDRLTPTHTTKAGRRHYYYISHRLISGGPDPTGWRLPGPKLEAFIADAIAGHLHRAAREHRLLLASDLQDRSHLLRVTKDLVQRLRKPDPDLLRDLLNTGTIARHEIALELNARSLAGVLDIDASAIASALCTFTVPIQLRRRGVEARLVAGDLAHQPDPVLTRTLLKAHQWVAALHSGTPLSIVAHDAGHHDVHIRTRAPLAFLSPKIQRAICDGSMPPDLTLHRFLTCPLPLDWSEQEKLFGIA